MDSFYTIMHANHVHEIGVVRSLLEANDITTFIKHEYTSQLYPMRNLEGVQLQIHLEDVPKAIKILEENNFYVEKPDKNIDVSDKDYVNNLFTEWTIFGNYKPIRNKILFFLVILVLLIIIYLALAGNPRFQ